MSVTTRCRVARKPHQCACGTTVRPGDLYLMHTEFPGGGAGYADGAGHPVRLAECQACAVRCDRGHLLSGVPS